MASMAASSHSRLNHSCEVCGDAQQDHKLYTCCATTMCYKCSRSSRHTCKLVGCASTPSGFLPTGALPEVNLPNTFIINRFLMNQPTTHDNFLTKANCQCRAECLTPDAYMEQTFTFPRTTPIQDRHCHDDYIRHMAKYPEERVYTMEEPVCQTEGEAYKCFTDEGIITALKERSRRLRKASDGWEIAERKSWNAADRDCKIQNQLDRHASQYAGPKFKNGQAVFQWWSHWFSDQAIKTPPESLNQKGRPKWYSGVVLGHQGLGDVLYAGLQHTNVHLYAAY